MILKACATCGKPSPGAYCSKHRPVNRRRQRMAMSGGRWETLRRKVIARDLRTCYLCGKRVEDGDEIDVDHLVEVAEGGSNEPSNLATCHRACHRRRHLDTEWARNPVAAALAVLAGVGDDSRPSAQNQDPAGAARAGKPTSQRGGS